MNPSKMLSKGLIMKLLKELTNNDVLILTKKIASLEKYYINQYVTDMLLSSGNEIKIVENKP